MNLKIIKRRWKTEAVCLPWKKIWITAFFCLFFGMITAFSGAGNYPVYYYLPKRSLPVLIVIFFWCITYFLLGIGLGIFLFTSKCRKQNRFHEHFCLFLCALIFSYTWIPLVIRGGNLFLGLFTCLALLGIFIFLIFSLRLYAPIVCIPLILSSFWSFYVLCYTFSLWLLNR